MVKEHAPQTAFRYNLKNNDPTKYIKVRLLSKKPLNVDLKTGKVKSRLEAHDPKTPSSCFSFTSAPKKEDSR